MMKERIRAGLRRAVCLLLCVTMLAESSMVLALNMPWDKVVERSDDDKKYNRWEVIVWKRVCSRWDLPVDNLWHPMLLTWGDGSYFLQPDKGSGDFDTKQWIASNMNGWVPNIATSRDTFITPVNGVSNLGIKYAQERDSKNDKGSYDADDPELVGGFAEQIKSHFNKSTNSDMNSVSMLTAVNPNVTGVDHEAENGLNGPARKYMIGLGINYASNTADRLLHQVDNEHLFRTGSVGSRYTVYTQSYGVSSRYGEDMHASDDDLKIFNEIGGKDFELYGLEDKFWAERDKDYAEDGMHLIMWIGERRYINQLTDSYTVPAGEVLNLDGNVMITEGTTITVAPGGVLSVDNTFYNNGVIRNYGTVVLQPGASVCTFFPTEFGKASEKCGQIICDGGTYTDPKTGETSQGEGNLLVMEGAKLVFDSSNQLLQVINGATVEIGGTIVSPGSILLMDADLYIREKGTLISQYGRNKNKKYVTPENWTMLNAGTLNVDFTPSLTKQASLTQDTGAVCVAGDYHFICDGVFKTAGRGLFSIDPSHNLGGQVPVTEGTGVWSSSVGIGGGTDVVAGKQTVFESYRTTDAIASIVYDTDKQMTTVTYRDGRVYIWYGDNVRMLNYTTEDDDYIYIYKMYVDADGWYYNLKPNAEPRPGMCYYREPYVYNDIYGSKIDPKNIKGDNWNDGVSRMCKITKKDISLRMSHKAGEVVEMTYYDDRGDCLVTWTDVDSNSPYTLDGEQQDAYVTVQYRSGETRTYQSIYLNQNYDIEGYTGYYYTAYDLIDATGPLGEKAISVSTKSIDPQVRSDMYSEYPHLDVHNPYQRSSGDTTRAYVDTIVFPDRVETELRDWDTLRDEVEPFISKKSGKYTVWSATFEGMLRTDRKPVTLSVEYTSGRYAGKYLECNVLVDMNASGKIREYQFSDYYYYLTFGKPLPGRTTVWRFGDLSGVDVCVAGSREDESFCVIGRREGALLDKVAATDAGKAAGLPTYDRNEEQPGSYYQKWDCAVFYNEFDAAPLPEKFVNGWPFERRALTEEQAIAISSTEEVFTETEGNYTTYYQRYTYGDGWYYNKAKVEDDQDMYYIDYVAATRFSNGWGDGVNRWVKVNNVEKRVVSESWYSPVLDALVTYDCPTKGGWANTVTLTYHSGETRKYLCTLTDTGTQYRLQLGMLLEAHSADGTLLADETNVLTTGRTKGVQSFYDLKDGKVMRNMMSPSPYAGYVDVLTYPDRVVTVLRAWAINDNFVKLRTTALEMPISIRYTAGSNVGKQIEYETVYPAWGTADHYAVGAYYRYAKGNTLDVRSTLWRLSDQTGLYVCMAGERDGISYGVIGRRDGVTLSAAGSSLAPYDLKEERVDLPYRYWSGAVYYDAPEDLPDAQLFTEGWPLGSEPGELTDEQKRTVEPGDIVTAYSDGDYTYYYNVHRQTNGWYRNVEPEVQYYYSRSYSDYEGASGSAVYHKTDTPFDHEEYYGNIRYRELDLSASDPMKNWDDGVSRWAKVDNKTGELLSMTWYAPKLDALITYGKELSYTYGSRKYYEQYLTVEYPSGEVRKYRSGPLKGDSDLNAPEVYSYDDAGHRVEGQMYPRYDVELRELLDARSASGEVPQKVESHSATKWVRKLDEEKNAWSTSGSETEAWETYEDVITYADRVETVLRAVNQRTREGRELGIALEQIPVSVRYTSGKHAGSVLQYMTWGNGSSEMGPYFFLRRYGVLDGRSLLWYSSKQTKEADGSVTANLDFCLAGATKPDSDADAESYCMIAHMPDAVSVETADYNGSQTGGDFSTLTDNSMQGYPFRTNDATAWFDSVYDAPDGREVFDGTWSDWSKLSSARAGLIAEYLEQNNKKPKLYVVPKPEPVSELNGDLTLEQLVKLTPEKLRSMNLSYEQVVKLRDMLEKASYVKVADILGVETGVAIGVWSDLLDELAEEIGEKRSTAADVTAASRITQPTMKARRREEILETMVERRQTVC